MLPDILEVANAHNLTFNPRTYGKKQSTCKCPFCYEDSQPHKRRKYYLSLNTQDMLYKCWFCGESGGVFRFMSLLEGRPESEIIAEYRKGRGSGYAPHPAERLSSSQLRLVGLRKPNWAEARKVDFEIYKSLRRCVLKAWEQFVEKEIRSAYRLFYLGIVTCTYEKQKERIKAREKVVGEPLFDRVLDVYSLPRRPGWCRQSERFVLEVCQRKLTRPSGGGARTLKRREGE